MDDATRDRPNRRDARTGARLPYDGDGSISDPSDAVRKVQRRSLFHETWFDSDGERRFAVLLEDEPDQAIKWFRPGPRDIHLYWNADQQYEPDFIVETAQQKLMIEVKSADEIEDSDVQKKARAAVDWCSHASAHSDTFGGKRWKYLLVPDTAIGPTATLDALIAQYEVRA